MGQALVPLLCFIFGRVGWSLDADTLPPFSFFVLGSDFNLQESDFSELDPHAVASIFKAYLRERKFLICIYHALHSTTSPFLSFSHPTLLHKKNSH